MKKLALLLVIVAALVAGIYVYTKQTPTKAPAPIPTSRPAKPISLNVVEQDLTVNGQTAKVYNIIQENGKEGFEGNKGDFFNVVLTNKTSNPVSIHWHGLIVPNDQDGVPYITQLPIQPGESRTYNYKLKQSGTYWMHSHFKYYEQLLQTAPYIIHNPNEHKQSDQEITVMFQDFTFKNPETILKELHGGDNPESKSSNMNHANMDHAKMNHADMQHGANGHAGATHDLNDVKYDAFLANRKTMDNPPIYTVKPDSVVRLRLINGSSATNFWVITDKLAATAVAVDGNRIEPFKNNQFQIAVAQRIDLLVKIPKQGGVFPIFAQVEGLKDRAGVILATEGETIPSFNTKAEEASAPLDNEQEFNSHSIQQLAKQPITRTIQFDLTGDMKSYQWKINNQSWPIINPPKIKQGDRVQMIFKNDTMMAHPMHFHGHVFKVTEINSKPIDDGPMRDTILVLPNTVAKIEFDANNPGIWATHCHMLYHMLSGMMTTTNYDDYPEPKFYQDLINGKIKE